MKIPYSKMFKAEQDFYFLSSRHQNLVGTTQIDMLSNIFMVNRWLALSKLKIALPFPHHFLKTEDQGAIQPSHVFSTMAVASDNGAKLSADLFDTNSGKSVVIERIKKLFCAELDKKSKMGKKDCFTINTADDGGLELFIHPSMYEDFLVDTKARDLTSYAEALVRNILYSKMSSTISMESAKTAIKTVGEEVAPVIQALNSFFGTDLGHKKILMSRKEVRVPLSFDFSTLFPLEYVGKGHSDLSTAEKVHGSIVETYGKHIDLLVTMLPHENYVEEHRKHIRSVEKEADGRHLSREDAAHLEFDEVANPLISLCSLRIEVTPIFKFSPEYASYLTQSSPPSLSYFYMWANMWIDSTYGKGGCAYKIGTKSRSPEMVFPIPDAFYQEQIERTDENGTYVAISGSFRFAPKNLGTKNAEKYGNLLDQAIQSSRVLGEPINWSRRTVDIHTGDDSTQQAVDMLQQAVDMLQQAKDGLNLLKHTPLTVDWHNNLMICVSKTDPSKLQAINLDAASIPRKIAISSILSEAGPIALEKFITVRKDATLMTRLGHHDVFMSTHVMQPISQVYAFLSLHGNICSVSDYIRKAEDTLTADGKYTDFIRTIDKSAYLPFADFIAAGSMDDEDIEGMDREQLAESLSASQLQEIRNTFDKGSLAAFYGSPGYRRMIYEQQMFTKMSSAWARLLVSVGDAAYLNRVKDHNLEAYQQQYGDAPVENLPFFYQCWTDPISSMKAVESIRLGLAFSLLLKDVHAKSVVPGSILFDSTACENRLINGEPILPHFDVMSAHVMPLLNLLCVYVQSAGENATQDQTHGETMVPEVAGATNLAFFPHQMKGLGVLSTHPDKAIQSVDAGGGKCLVGNSLVPTEDGLLRLDEIWDQADKETEYRGFRAIITNIKSIGGRQQADAVYRREGKTWKTTFNDGTTVEGLKEHKLWVYDVNTKASLFKRLDQVEKGDWVEKAVCSDMHNKRPSAPIDTRNFNDSDPKFVDFLNRGGRLPTHMTDALAALLGYVTCSINTPSIILPSTDSDVIENFVDMWVFTFGVFPKLEETSPGVTVVTGCIIEKGFLLSCTQGIGGDSALSVPLCIRCASFTDQKAFLKALFSCHGHVHNSATGSLSIGVVSTSEDFVVQVRWLLENIGVLTETQVISSRINFGLDDEGYSISYCVQVQADDYEINDFFRTVELIGAKQEKVSSYLENVVFDSTSTRTPCTYCPCGEETSELYEILLDIVRTQSGMTEEQFNNYCNIRQWDMAVGDACPRPFAKKLLSVAKCGMPEGTQIKTDLNVRVGILVKHIEQLVDKYYIRVVKSLPTGEMKTVYDLSVPEGRNYSVNGIYGHNTIMGLTDMINIMGKRLVRRPLVVCPQPLIKTWADELNKITGGKYNAVPIETKTFKRLSKDDTGKGGLGEKGLTDVLLSAPPNTIFFTSFSFLRSRSPSDTVTIGNLTKKVYPNVEFFRKLGIDMITIDESHKLKNQDSQQKLAVSLLTSDPHVRYVRLLSGTFVMDKLTDIVAQTSLLDPTLFRTTDAFIREWSPDGNPANLRAGAGAKIRNLLEDRVSMVSIGRKEWAWMLPAQMERVHTVTLPDCLSTVYSTLLEKQVKLLFEHPKLKNMVESQAMDPDFDIEVEIDKVVLSRLEQFVHDPFGDEFGAKVLGDTEQCRMSPDDLLPPKVKKVKDLLKEHFDQGDPGKILVFTRNIRSAIAIYENLGEYKKIALPYHASGLSRNLGIWMKNPEVKVLVAVSFSLNTGYNLQMASRLIRVDIPWTPGELDQEWARLFRPDVGKTFGRKAITLDWVLCDGTTDVAKFGRLVSKVMRKSEYDEVGNSLYDSLSTPKPISMSLATLRDLRDFKQIKEKYVDLYFGEYRRIVEQELVDRKSAASANGEDIMVPAVVSDMFAGSEIMEVVPFIGGQDLYDHHGWNPVCATIFTELPDNKEYKEDPTLFVGKYVATELGYGVVKGVRYNKNGDQKVSSLRVHVVGYKKPITFEPEIVHILMNPPTDKDHLFVDGIKSVEEPKNCVGTYTMWATNKPLIIDTKEISFTYPENERFSLDIGTQSLLVDGVNAVKTDMFILDFLMSRSTRLACSAA